MRFYAPIAKVDEERRMVFGYASTAAEDADGEMITLGALEGALDDYMKFANVREMHQLSAVGKVKEAAIDDKGLYVGAKVVDDDAWNKVVEGVYSGFSVGGRALARDPADRTIITKLKLTEISLVDRPCNPEAVFDCWKAADAVPPSLGDDMPKNAASYADALVAAFVEGKEIPIAKAAPVDGEDAAMPTGDDPVEPVAPGNSGEETVGKPVDGHAAPIAPKGGDVEIVAPGNSGEDVTEKPVDGKRPPIVPPGDGDPVQIVNPDGEKVEIDLDLMKLDDAGEEDPVVKRSFTAAQRRAAAKSGAAMKDGSFPIENKGDLANAIRAIGRAKDPAAAKAHIKRRAKALGMESELPDSWKTAKAATTDDIAKHIPVQIWSCGNPEHNHLAKAEAARCIDQQEAITKAAAAVKPAADAVAQLRGVVSDALAKAGHDPEAAKPEIKKGLYTLSDLACMVLQLRGMVCNVDYEETAEADGDSRLPQLMRDALKALVEAFRAMSDEETEELLESVATNTAEPDHAASFLYMAAHVGDIMKAGARHSKADIARIQKAHDMLTELGAVCKADGDYDDAGKVEKVEKALAERDAELGELRKLVAEISPLAKVVGTLGDTIEKIRSENTDLAAKVAKLEAEPMPPKTAANPHAVEKADDGKSPASDAAMIEQISKMTEEERGLLLAKAALRNPITVKI